MQIAIDLPNDFVQFQTESDIQQEIRVSYAIWLFQHQRVTLSKAAELAGLNIYDFMVLCKANQVPVIDLTRDEIIEELNSFHLS
jgi:predicted HTH domain antitoxin